MGVYALEFSKIQWPGDSSDEKLLSLVLQFLTENC
jgi:hypothetical protein